MNLRQRLQSTRAAAPILPYDPQWTELYWLQYAEGMTLSEEEGVLIDLGSSLGSYCRKEWNVILEMSTWKNMPRLISALIDEVNSIFLSRYSHIKYNLKFDTHGSPEYEELLDQLMSENNKLDECELVLNSFSNLIFALFKKGVKTKSNLHLPDAPYEEGLLKYIAKIIVERLIKISSVKFVVDRAIFGEAKVSRSGNSFFVKLSDSDMGRRYLERNAFSRWLQDFEFVKAHYEGSGKTRYFLGGYKLVRQVRVYGDRVEFDSCAAEEVLGSSRITKLLNTHRKEIVVDLLRNYNLSDVVKTWDLLHSISIAMQMYALRQNDQEVFSAEFFRNQLINMVSDALSVTRARARRAIENLMIVKRCHDGIWSCPLVPIDNQRVAVCHPAILANNPARFFSQLISNFNLNSERGYYFEALCVRTLRELLSRAPKAWDIELLESNHELFTLLGRKKYQTDLIIRVETNLIICDAKSTSHIATEREFRHALLALEKGAMQIEQRVSRVKSSLKQVHRMLGLKGTNSIGIFGCVITNEVYFDGDDIDGNWVISLTSLVENIEKLYCMRKVEDGDTFLKLCASIKAVWKSKVDRMRLGTEYGFLKVESSGIEVHFDYATVKRAE